MPLSLRVFHRLVENDKFLEVPGNELKALVKLEQKLRKRGEQMTKMSTKCVLAKQKLTNQQIRFTNFFVCISRKKRSLC